MMHVMFIVIYVLIYVGVSLFSTTKERVRVTKISVVAPPSYRLSLGTITSPRRTSPPRLGSRGPAVRIALLKLPPNTFFVSSSTHRILLHAQSPTAFSSTHKAPARKAAPARRITCDPVSSTLQAPLQSASISVVSTLVAASTARPMFVVFAPTQPLAPSRRGRIH